MGRRLLKYKVTQSHLDPAELDQRYAFISEFQNDWANIEKLVDIISRCKSFIEVGTWNFETYDLYFFMQ
jgi:DNA mismatch repair ATPase MutS